MCTINLAVEFSTSVVMPPTHAEQTPENHVCLVGRFHTKSVVLRR